MAQVAEAAPPRLRQPSTVLRATARGGLVNLAGAAVAGLSGLVITWLVAAGLGPRVAGQFFTATTAFLLALAIARLGTPTGLVYWFARLRQEGRHGELRSMLTAALVPVCALSLVFAVAGLVFAESFASAGILRVLAVFLPAAVLMEALLAASRGFGGMRESVLIDKLGRSGTQVVLLAAIVLGWQTGVFTVTVAWALPFLPAALLSAHVVRLRLRRDPPDPDSPSWTQQLRPFWTYTAPRALAGVAQLGLQRLDILLVATLLGFAQAAVYTVATRFVTVGQLISGAIGTAVQPRLATSMSGRDYATASTLYRTTTSWIVLACWPVYLLVALAAPWYLRVFGPEYVTGEAIAVVWVLAAGMLLATACGVVDSVLVMAGRTGWQLYNVAAAFAVNIVVDLLLIPRIGILGAAIGWTAGIAVNNLMPLLQLARVYRLHPIGRATLKAMALSGLCCGLIPGVAALAGEAALAVAIGGCAVIYPLSAWRARKTLFTTTDT
ncbi:lipopolysaccharide biosynthesis protein [Stackebrandtia nassauensis]|uniref:Multi antimicrobial extrusion protein MatE n=1 Tax=Stackebrandtia nassauensis (strain DSM 44728 / CIP 108903 / NRRL B-16338 / NBRC 102104 / LLR-40K-21) TaxID=446470 RepID=D3Q947_STANL|nr:polysaccharide biosynthesis C-terminal domain-containing protein [Stackebrandtia nassauensis]ADD40656.1 multi antimicrobial extrusion protein MatE [Stackebrandtia nassauensis DSM 44728]